MAWTSRAVSKPAGMREVPDGVRELMSERRMGWPMPPGRRKVRLLAVSAAMIPMKVSSFLVVTVWAA